MATVGSVSVDVVPDTRNFARDLREKLSRLPNAQVRVSADISSALASINELQARLRALDRGSARPDIFINGAAARAELDDLRARLDRLERTRATARVRVDVDSSGLDGLAAKLKGAGGGLKVASVGIATAATVAVPAITGLGAAAVPVIGGLGSAFATAGIGISLFTLVTKTAIKQATKDAKNLLVTQKAAGTSSAQLATAQRAVAAAQANVKLTSGITPGQTAATNALARARLALAGATGRVSSASPSASVASAQASVQRAQLLNSQGLARAQLALAQAQKRLDAATTPAAKLSAQAAVQRAQLGLSQQQATASGRLATAQGNLTKAQTPLSTASAQNAVQKAQLGLSQAQARVTAAGATGSLAHQKAVAALAVAQGKLTAAQDKNATAQGKLNVATKAYTPAEQSLTASVKKIKGAFHDFISQQIPAISGALHSFLPVMADGFKAATPLITGVSGALVGLETKAHAALNTPFYQKFFGFLSKDAPKAITALGTAAGNLATGFLGLIQGFFPVQTAVLRSLNTISQRFAQFGMDAASGKNKPFNQFIAFTQKIGPDAAATLKSIGGLVGTILQALAPAIQPALRAIQDIAKILTPVVKGIGAALPGVIGGFDHLVRSIGDAEKKIGPALKQLGPALAIFGRSFTNVLANTIKAVGTAVGWIGKQAEAHPGAAKVIADIAGALAAGFVVGKFAGLFTVAGKIVGVTKAIVGFATAEGALRKVKIGAGVGLIGGALLVGAAAWLHYKAAVKDAVATIDTAYYDAQSKTNWWSPAAGTAAIQGVQKTGEAAQKSLGWFDKLGAGIAATFSSLNTNDQVAQYTKNINKPTDEATRKIAELRRTMLAYSIVGPEVARATGLSRDAIGKLATQAGVSQGLIAEAAFRTKTATRQGSAEQASALGQITAAVLKQRLANQNATAASLAYASGMKVITDSSNSATAKVSGLDDALKGLLDPQVSLNSTVDSWRRSFDGLAKTASAAKGVGIDPLTGGVSTITKRGSDLSTQFDSMSSSLHRTLVEMANGHEPISKMEKVIGATAGGFKKAGQLADYSKPQIHGLLKQYGLLPSQVSTLIKTYGASQAKKDVGGVVAATKAIPAVKMVKLATTGQVAAAAAAGQLQRIVGHLPPLKTITLKQVGAANAQLAIVNTARKAAGLPPLKTINVRQIGAKDTIAQIINTTLKANGLPKLKTTQIRQLGADPTIAQILAVTRKATEMPPLKTINIRQLGANPTIAQIINTTLKANGLPALKTVNIRQLGADPTMAKIIDTTLKANGLPPLKTINVKQLGADPTLRQIQNFAGKVNTALRGIKDRKITVSASGTFKTGSIGKIGGTGPRGFSTGGPVHGPGGPRSDSIPIDVSNGEFVVNAPATAMHRSLLEAINNAGNTHPTGTAGRFANGGLVDLRTHFSDPTLIARQFDKSLLRFEKSMAGSYSKYLRTHGPAAGGGGGGAGGGGPVLASGSLGTIVRQTIQQLGRPRSEEAGWLRRIMFESGGSLTAVNRSDSNWPAHPCVPLDSLILTRRGWLRHDQVTTDDETLGYNPETGRSKWTRVTAVHHYDDAEVWEIGNGSWRARATPNHRWWTDRFVDHVVRDTTCPECGLEWATERGMETHLGRAHGQRLPKVRTVAGSFVETQDLAAGDRLRLAAPADTDGIPGLTVDDARIIAWLQGDGHVSPALAKPVVCPECRWTPGTGRRPYRGPVAQPGNSVAVHRAKAHRVSKHDTEGTFDGSYDGSIYQAKPEQVIRLRALLAYVPHTEHVRQRQAEHLPEHHFKLRRAYVTDLLKRARWDELTPSALVLAMSPDQRAGWLDAMIDAEGNRQAFAGKGWTEFVRISQNDGDVLDAIALAVFLEGYRPALARRRREAPYQPHSVVSMCGPHVAPSMFEAPKSQGAQPVWCVTTELGTWTMRQDRRIMLTGNSVGLAQVIRGTFQANAGPYLNVGPFAYGVSENGMANSYAGAHYAIGRYGSLAAVDPRTRPIGYKGGGALKPGPTLVMNEYRQPETVLPPRESAALRKIAASTAGDSGSGGTHLHVHGDVNHPVDLDLAMRKLNFAAMRS